VIAGDRFRAGVERVTSAVRGSPTARVLVSRLPLAAGLSALLLPLIAVGALAIVWPGGGQPPGEFDRFGPAGAALLTGQWTLPYSDAGVQAGPFELAGYGLAALLGVSGVVGWSVFAIIGGYLLTVALLMVLFLPRDGASNRLARFVPLAVGAVGWLAVFLPSAIGSGHPSQVVIPLCWIVAGCLAAEGRPVAFGVLLGISAGWEVWGILGAPLVLLAARPRPIRAGLAALATLAVIYLPFVIAGPFRMFSKEWGIDGGSLVHLLLPGADTFPWPWRLVQTAVALIAGAGLALLCRRTDHGLWLAPLAIVVARLAFDPLVLPYYWIAPVTIALCFAGALALRRRWLGAGAAALVPVLALVPGGRSPWGALLVLAGCIAAGILIAARTPAEQAVR